MKIALTILLAIVLRHIGNWLVGLPVLQPMWGESWRTIAIDLLMYTVAFAFSYWLVNGIYSFKAKKDR